MAPTLIALPFSPQPSLSLYLGWPLQAVFQSEIQHREKEGWELDQKENGPRALMAGKESIPITEFSLSLFTAKQWGRLKGRWKEEARVVLLCLGEYSLAQPSPTVIPASTRLTHLRFQLLRSDPSKRTLPPCPRKWWWRLLAVANLWWLHRALFHCSFFHILLSLFPVTKVPLFYIL